MSDLLRGVIFWFGGGLAIVFLYLAYAVWRRYAICSECGGWFIPGVTRCDHPKWRHKAEG